MSIYEPRNLPAVSSVKVFALGKHIWGNELAQARMQKVGNSSESIFSIDENWSFMVSRSVTLTGEDATHIAELWRQLPEGVQARCHIPAFGLHLATDTQVHTIASICWQCNNIFLLENGERKSYEFDSQSGIAQQLLKMLTAYTKLM